MGKPLSEDERKKLQAYNAAWDKGLAAAGKVLSIPKSQRGWSLGAYAEADKEGITNHQERRVFVNAYLSRMNRP
jgi:hypothetical protein